MKRLELNVENQNEYVNAHLGFPDDRQGVHTISIHGSTLELAGWYDSVAEWGATVKLTPGQMDELRRALADETEAA